jgi:predicted GIY-YIG superfamily endonuclease
MSELERERKAEIEAIELTEEEVKAAIQEAKIKKWFRQFHQSYWEQLEFKSRKQNEDVRNRSYP